MISADLSENVKWHWQALDERGHEMQLCNSVNKVHPLLEYRVHGLDADKNYEMRLHFEQTEEKRFDPQDGKLKSYLDADVPCAEANRDPQVVWHQQGAQSGSDWMKAPFGFHDLRITSKQEAKQDSVVLLRRFHAYTPTLVIFEDNGTSKKPVSTTKLEYTKFITVRVILSKEVAELKRQNGVDKDALRKKFNLIEEKDGAGEEGDEEAPGEIEDEEGQYEEEDDADGAEYDAVGAERGNENEGGGAHQDVGFEVVVEDAFALQNGMEGDMEAAVPDALPNVDQPRTLSNPRKRVADEPLTRQEKITPPPLPRFHLNAHFMNLWLQVYLPGSTTQRLRELWEQFSSPEAMAMKNGFFTPQEFADDFPDNSTEEIDIFARVYTFCCFFKLCWHSMFGNWSAPITECFAISSWETGYRINNYII
ncbi:hypothetical protein CAEBREN_13272 [Caenorhabditis brenneri]|uniref:T-box domain-containing protein n=1 Tax=Caenorhabditis brenneri TaxID=135651 RepID=G0MBD2_CAEBE|nr:hypothetical protein CAEBREN_13272 [Caenorhabditis brenneri]